MGPRAGGAAGIQVAGCISILPCESISSESSNPQGHWPVVTARKKSVTAGIQSTGIVGNTGELIVCGSRITGQSSVQRFPNLMGKGEIPNCGYTEMEPHMQKYRNPLRLRLYFFRGSFIMAL
ncbi:MAG: hypothetical protein DBY39_00670 [Clostridiales bacterium]|nr:MAG: hypothetical protein DBY39_00670 [Clostridiales bacterium]